VGACWKTPQPCTVLWGWEALEIDERDPVLLGAVETVEGDDGQALDEQVCHELMLSGEVFECVVMGEPMLLAAMFSVAAFPISMASRQGASLFEVSTLLARTCRGLAACWSRPRPVVACSTAPSPATCLLPWAASLGE
jgi:hypothetical protein